MRRPDVEGLAERLFDARRNHSPLAIGDSPELTEDDAYEVQRLFVGMLCADGSRGPAGFKLSMTSPETQALAAATGPAYGTFTSDMILNSDSELSMSSCFEPRLELELQVIPTEDLSPGAKRPEIEAKCLVAPGIEVPDSRFRGWFGRLSVGHIVSDLGLAGHVIVGPTMPLRGIGDLPSLAGELYHNKRVVAKGEASTVMGDPIIALEWLTDRLQGEGRILGKGAVVSSGTLSMPVAMELGSYRALYSEVGEVRLSVFP